jgi:hypothetical protein
MTESATILKQTHQTSSPLTCRCETRDVCDHLHISPLFQWHWDTWKDANCISADLFGSCAGSRGFRIGKPYRYEYQYVVVMVAFVDLLGDGATMASTPGRVRLIFWTAASQAPISRELRCVNTGRHH